ncbi:FecR family protein [Ottowia thiooxydans]|uniref:FecR family protein n=1 Tax=Ottowia thiooxydans TaxID=219182 RepID=UPI00048B1D08|nr:FecR domain-containing protein [Ottowia thiooxydans]
MHVSLTSRFFSPWVRPAWWAGLLVGFLPLLVVAQSHVVRPGDTLWGVARSHLQEPLRWVELQQRNGLANPHMLRPGTVLDLGGAPVQGTLVAEVQGQAWLRRAGQPPQEQRVLEVGVAVAPGDVLLTEAKAFVRLRMADGSHVVLPSSSALQLEDVAGPVMRLRLLQGRVESHVEKQGGKRGFEVRTRSVGLGVRGTYFRVRDEDGVVGSEVLEGAVLASAPAQPGAAARSQALVAGQGATLAGPQAFVPQALLPAPVLESGVTTAAGVPSRRLHVSPVAGAVAYRLQLARDERFFSLVHEQRSESPVFVLPDELVSDFYQVRFTAIDGLGLEGIPGDSLVGVPPAAGAVASGKVSVVPLADGRFEIRWPGVAGQIYRFSLSRNADMVPVLAEDAAVATPGMVVGPFSLPGRYFWRVEAAHDAAAQALSGSFEVPAAAR